MNTFDFVYSMVVEPLEDDGNTFELPSVVTVLVEPAEPESGIPYRVITLEGIKVSMLSEADSDYFWKQMGITLYQAIEAAAWEALTKLEGKST